MSAEAAGTAPMNVAEAVGRVLAALGVDTVFGVVGSGNFHVTNALTAAGARFVAARHEAGAATMADAWARVTGRPGIVTVHQGPGLTNAMTGIAEAAKSRTPLVVLTGETAGAAVLSNFRVDQAALAVAVGATPERVHSPASALDDVVRAYRTAADQRRTVVLGLPLDIQAMPAPPGLAQSLRTLAPAHLSAPPPSATASGGAASGGAAPGGAAPGGAAPSGAAPSGAAPSGAAPSGAAPSGAAPSGAAPGGAALGAAASGAVAPGGVGAEALDIREDLSGGLGVGAPRVTPAGPSAEGVRLLAELLASARRPVFVAGRGARGAGPQLRELGHHAGALLATSAVARGLFRGDPYDLDVSGGFATPLAAELIRGADLIVGWGCALNMWTMRHGNLIGPDATVVQVDLEPSSLGAHRPIDLGVVGDVATTALAVAQLLTNRTHATAQDTPQAAQDTPVAGQGTPDADQGPRNAGQGTPDAGQDPRDAGQSIADAGHGTPGAGPGIVDAGHDVPARDAGGPVGYRTPGIAERIAAEGRWGQVPYEDAGDGERIDPRTLSRAVDEMLPPNRVIGVDSGNFMGHPAMYLEVPDENGLIFTQAYQSIGLGLATAIGGAIALPDRLPIAALGDGGALMSIADLETAVRLRLGMLVLIYDDEAYGAEVHHFGPDGHPLDTVTFPPTDIAEIARGFGCEATVVRRTEDLAPLHKWLEGPRERPFVVDAKITPAASWWLEEAFRGH